MPSTYVVSSPIIALYYTVIMGDARVLPTIVASAGFSGMAVIDAGKREHLVAGFMNPHVPPRPIHSKWLWRTVLYQPGAYFLAIADVHSADNGPHAEQFVRDRLVTRSDSPQMWLLLMLTMIGLAASGAYETWSLT